MMSGRATLGESLGYFVDVRKRRGAVKRHNEIRHHRFSVILLAVSPLWRSPQLRRCSAEPSPRLTYVTAQCTVHGLERDGVLLERYRYPAGPPIALPRHLHVEYQLNVNLGEAAGVEYRGGYHVVPAGRLAVIMPGETHTPRDPGHRARDALHLTMYVAAETMVEAARAVAGRRTGTPTFVAPVIDDVVLVERFLGAHATLTSRAPALARDVRLLSVVTELVERHAGRRAACPSAPNHRAVLVAREYLHDNVRADISLAQLSAVSELSRYRLSRLFSGTFGVPPHTYQLQLRLELAKRLMLAGRSATDAAHESGFFDLSHFSRHFKRYVGVSPGSYTGELSAGRDGKRVHLMRRHIS
jgi:AraC-like DNA-binding protein